jgi:hypothetical protein
MELAELVVSTETHPPIGCNVISLHALIWLCQFPQVAHASKITRMNIKDTSDSTLSSNQDVTNGQQVALEKISRFKDSLLPIATTKKPSEPEI